MAELTSIRRIESREMFALESEEEGSNLKSSGSQSLLSPDTNSRLSADKLRSPRSVASEKCIILKNILIISIAFLLTFTAFNAILDMQISLHRIERLKTIHMCIMYASAVVSCLLFPPLFIRKIGCKWTMVLSLVPYILYMAAHFYPTWLTLIPAGVLVGVTTGPLWAAKCTYISYAGEQYAQLAGESRNAAVTKLFGVFFLLFQTTKIWETLISGFAIQQWNQNRIFHRLDRDEQVKCGPFYCLDLHNDDNSTAYSLSTPTLHIVRGTYVGVAALAFLILILFLDKFPAKQDYSDQDSPFHRSKCHLVTGTLRHWRRINQLLLIPLTVFSGLEQAFILSDYTKRYVQCSLGMWVAGQVVISFAVSTSVLSFILGKLTSCTGRLAIFITGALIHCCLLAVLFFWNSWPENLPVFFLVAILWGVGDAVWQTQINSLYANIFAETKESAFANYRLWETIGFIAAFAYSGYLCTYEKICILLGTLVLGTLGYIIVEYRDRLNKSK